MIGEEGEDEWIPDEENGPHLRVTEKEPFVTNNVHCQSAVVFAIIQPNEAVLTELKKTWESPNSRLSSKSITERGSE